MTMGQNAPVSFPCPRCGGPMYKPAGSSFYWHATTNHPPCSITSVVEFPEHFSVDVSPVEDSSEPLRSKNTPS
ncbi:hypothetical protein [Reticulibacter mediterranei]|uniref:hypothetical protein n=1 Tax=Reticulibacter mediterranei TaxID=2778369 RepID=UPI001C68ABD3|nr:hypothetical protein [Reticulibacter mediterranei]